MNNTLDTTAIRLTLKLVGIMQRGTNLANHRDQSLGLETLASLQDLRQTIANKRGLAETLHHQKRMLGAHTHV